MLNQHVTFIFLLVALVNSLVMLVLLIHLLLKKINVFIFGCAGSLLWSDFSFRERGLLSSCGATSLWCLLVAVASPVEHGLEGTWVSAVAAPRLQSAGSVVVVHGLTCPMRHGIFPDQGSNLCPLHWSVNSLPLCHQGSSAHSF